MDYPGNLFVVAAPSGAGKSSLVKALMELDSRVQPTVSHTTRAPRGQEKHGREYFFASAQEFDAMVLADAFVEWAHVHGQRYGTSKKMIEERMSQGSDVVLEIDYQGAIQIKQMYANAVLIFILPPSWDELSARLQGRGEDSAEVIAKRLQAAREDISHVAEFDYVIINEEFNVALSEMSAIVRATRSRFAQQMARNASLFAQLGIHAQ